MCGFGRLDCGLMGEKMENKDSRFVRIIKEICMEEEIALTFYADCWVMELKKNGITGHIFGYQFGLNSSVSQQISNDKSCAYEILADHGIEAVKHVCFMTPEQMKYVGSNGCFLELTDLLKQWGELVVKDNEGTGGMEVYRAANRVELEHIAVNLLPRVRSIAVSPFIDIEEEYRVILLDGKVRMIFSKERKSVEGDGSSNVGQLFANAVGKNILDPTGITLNKASADFVPAAGEIYYLSWKHNLGQGAKAIERTEEMIGVLEPIAVAAADVLGLRFASVDIIKEKGTGKLSVLEVNSGVMCENLAGSSHGLYLQVKEIYRDAICRMLEK